jgi:DNA-binding response OmpR family regulator
MSASPASDAARIILVLDRDPAIRALLTCVLRQAGFSVREGSGSHALDLCNATGQRVDCVLAEEPMHSRAGVPVVLLSKPFFIRDLTAKLEAALNGRARSASAKQHSPQSGVGMVRESEPRP